MKSCKIFSFARILLSTVALFALAGCGYNQMQANEEEVFAAWGNLESALQRRADLIPNLVATVKGYAAHEKETLSGVIEARAKATSVTLSPKMLADPQAMKNFNAAQGQLSSWLSKLMMIQERYPNLKADQQFGNLMHQLEGTENRINVARQRYNEAVKIFNYSIRKFPNSMTNSILLDLERKEFFEADAAAKVAPSVNFAQEK